MGSRRVLIVAALALQVSAAAAEERLIVKLSADAAKSALTPKAHIAKLGRASGATLAYVRPMALGAHVVAIDARTGAVDAQALAARLAREPDVDFAQVDARRYALQTNDQYLITQHYLPNDPAAISAFSAWEVTTGSAATVVAVIDSGYVPHRDLEGRMLAGYDFIHDPAIANDGDGRDADATDPGDWLTASDITGQFGGCAPEPSSWHGTSVAGVIGATANNGLWTAGIDWNARILPVRVLGRCGGYTSDVVDGIAWAGGIAVPGIPGNPTPAQVINLSLGGAGPCSTAEQIVADDVLAFGITRAIVVAAGNEAQDVANDTPASCTGVIAVASTTSTGRLARYSNFGAGIALSAPGGTVNLNLPDEGIFVLSNSGTTTADGPPPYGDTIKSLGGTSFAAPMVTGTISLMLAVAPYLTATQIRQILAATAKPFPTGSNCTTTTCGAGIVDAGAAVRAAAATPVPAGLDIDQHGLTGSWFEPATSGQGVEIEVFPDRAAPGTAVLQVSWFTFDTAAGGADRQRWYTLGGYATRGSPAGLTIYQNIGGNFDAAPVTLAQAVGSATLRFDSCTSGRLAYFFTDGSQRSGAIPLTRLARNVTCADAGPPPTDADFALSGNWYNAATSGQGISVEVNPSSGALFFAWYTYAPGGATLGAAGQRWYTGQATIAPGARSIPLTLYETTGGVFDTPTPAAQGPVPVGTGKLTFATCSSASLDYAFTAGSSAGRSGTIPLTRVGPNPPGCA